MSERKIQVLVVDDSAYGRRTIAQILESEKDMEVVDRASDGDEGLRKAAQLRPDLITLDLEMPKLDGFSFLRLLMATAPTPVIVISSYAHKADVFKALELGAFDFVPKPKTASRSELQTMRDELLKKVRSVRSIRASPQMKELPRARKAEPIHVDPVVVAVAASTGGPPAVQRILEAVGNEASLSLLVVQHMPSGFTRAFADRLDRITGLTVKEARDGEKLVPGKAFIAPGGRHMVLGERDGEKVVRTLVPSPHDRAVPSADKLFASVAHLLGARGLGVVLTGMGADGAQGAREIKEAGGEVWAEAEESAVVFGMPKEAIDTGAVKRVLKLDDIGPALVRWIRAQPTR